MHLLVGFPIPWLAAYRKSVAGFFLVVFLVKIISKTTVFGRPLAQQILAALSLHPVEVKESLEKYKPENFGEAKNLPGMTPAAAAILLSYVKK